MDSYLLVAGVCAVLAVIFAVVKFGGIMKKDAGDSNMQEISRQVQEGAVGLG